MFLLLVNLFIYVKKFQKIKIEKFNILVSLQKKSREKTRKNPSRLAPKKGDLLQKKKKNSIFFLKKLIFEKKVERDPKTPARMARMARMEILPDPLDFTCRING